MIHFITCDQKYLISILIFSMVSISLLIVNTHVGIVSATVSNTTQKRIPVYEITTRGNLVSAQGVEGSGYLNTYNLSDSRKLNITCPDEVAIFIHGWGQNETEAKERFDRVKMSLEKNTYTNISLVGFSWDSDTEWMAAKFIAKWNGPKLADFIVHLKNDCKNSGEDVKVRLIGHSLGARVILSALDSLHKNATWNDNNFKIASVDLMGAAVDDEEVTTNPKDILNDKTNWGSPKSDYGQAIEEEVNNFYNLFSTKDNVLEPNPETFFPIYPLFEGDLALGQSGHQKGIALPKNYNDTNDKDVTDQIIAMRNADGIEAEVFGMCDNNHPLICTIKTEGWDLGLCNLLIDPPKCQVNKGDNHAGYIGFRNNVTKTLLADDGAMNVVVNNWRNNG
jgi:pimeloyl-ACP methyl ester carboxylesterase